MRRFIVAVLFLFSVGSQAQDADESLIDEVISLSVSSTELFTDPFTAEQSCVDYCFEGTCFWLDCEIFPPSCSVKTSLRVSHRNPDFVVSAFPNFGENPWDEFADLWGGAQEEAAEEVISWIGAVKGIAGGGEAVTTNEQQPTKHYNNSTTFREVDVVGYLYDFSDYSDEAFCGSNTTALTPHYSSAFDGYLWRLGVTDVFYTPLIFLDAIGYPYVKEWGSIYWRTGFIKQLDPAKANAVLSMRGVHIASRDNETRVYYPATGEPDTDQRFFNVPGESEADGSDGSVWQMNAPVQDDGCYIFDEIAEDETAGADTWSKDRFTGNQSSSVYTVWRPYECCKKQDDEYLFSVEVQICLDEVLD